MHTVSSKRRTMAVLAVVVLLVVAGAAMAHCIGVWQHYRLDLPPGHRTDFVDRPMNKRALLQLAKDNNTYIEPGTIGSNLVRTRIVQNNAARTRATQFRYIRSGQEVNLPFLSGHAVVGRSYLLAQNVVPFEGCPFFTVTTTGTWSPDQFH